MEREIGEPVIHSLQRHPRSDYYLCICLETSVLVQDDVSYRVLSYLATITKAPISHLFGKIAAAVVAGIMIAEVLHHFLMRRQ